MQIEEKKIFNFIDLDKDNNLSLEEINNFIKLIYQLVDVDANSKISIQEIIELKKIINLLT